MRGYDCTAKSCLKTGNRKTPILRPLFGMLSKSSANRSMRHGRRREEGLTSYLVTVHLTSQHESFLLTVGGKTLTEKTQCFAFALATRRPTGVYPSTNFLRAVSIISQFFSECSRACSVELLSCASETCV